MANFDKYSNYNEKAGVSSIVFGANSPVLEVELNEMQQIQNNTMKRLVKNVIGNGISNPSKLTFTGGAIRISNDCDFCVDGYLIHHDTFDDDLRIPVEEGETLYIHVWEEVKDYRSTLYVNGNNSTPLLTVPNYFKDSRFPGETSRRTVLCYEFSVNPTKSGAKTLALASVENAKLNSIVKEINLSKLTDKVNALQEVTGFYDEGIIGVEVDLENNTVKRFGENQLWEAGDNYNNHFVYKNRKRCNVTDSGAVVAYWGDDAYTETGALNVSVRGKNGVTYPVGTKVQCMVIQPKFYYKRIPLKVEPITNANYNVKGVHLVRWIDLISPTPKEGYKLHPAFKKGNIELDYYFIGENEGCVEDNNGVYDLTDSMTIPASPYTGYKFSSVANTKPASGATKAGDYPTGVKALTRDAIRQMCANRGADWQQLDLTIISAEQMLYLIEFASFKNINGTTLVKSYSSGVNDAYPNPENNNGNDTVIMYHSTYVEGTGSVLDYAIPVYRGVKNPYANITKFVDGVLRNYPNTTANNEVYWQDGSLPFSDNLADYIPIGFSWATEAGFVKYFGYSEIYDFTYIPTSGRGTSSKPVGASHSMNMSNVGNFTVRQGSYWTPTNESKLFQLDATGAIAHTSAQIGGRLCRKSANIIFAV